MNRKKFAIIIPAFNESATIAKVIRDAQRHGSVIVVDDGSTDDTHERAQNCGVILIKFEENKGYDAALNAGIWRAIELNFNFVITIDADGQHDPNDIMTFKEKLLEGADVVVGDRCHTQRNSEAIFSCVTSLLWGIKDPLCGLKGYRLEKIKPLGFFDSYKSIGTEFLMRALRSNYSVESVPINIRKREGASTFGGGLMANYKIIRALVIGLFFAKPILGKYDRY